MSTSRSPDIIRVISVPCFTPLVLYLTQTEEQQQKTWGVGEQGYDQSPTSPSYHSVAPDNPASHLMSYIP